MLYPINKREVEYPRMVSRELGEDASFLLYFVPIVVSIVYGAYEWFSVSPHSSSMPLTAYLIVSKSPYLYLVSIIVICAALIIDVASAPINEREALIGVHATRMQILSVLVLIVSFFAAVSVAGYGIVNGFSVFIAGRYALIFPFSLVAISIILVPRQILGSARASAYAEILGLVLIVAAPIILYLGYKLNANFDASVIITIIVAFIGIYLYMNSSKLFRKKTQSAPASQNPPQRQNPPTVAK